MKHLFLVIGMVWAGVLCSRGDLPDATPDHLPRWRGFNLQNLFWDRGREIPFQEEDFKKISKLGFNFLRIPVSYRLITFPEEFREIDPERLEKIDQVIDWGVQYGIHICLNLFQVPGYCITPEPEPRWPSSWNLWEDEEPQEIFARYWGVLAKRYHGIPNRNLSFNLINENHWDTPETAYARVMRRAIEAIRSEDPDRLMIVDGMRTATVPCWELADAGVAQSMHFYKPMELTHYGADWIKDPPSILPRKWPLPLVSRHLYGPRFSFRTPFVIHGTFREPYRFMVDLDEIAASEAVPLTLAVTADGRTVLERTFAPGSESGGRYLEQHGLYLVRIRKPLTAEIPAGTRRIRMEVTAGDRLTLRKISLLNTKTEGEVEIIPVLNEWKSQQSPLRYTPDTGITAEHDMDREWLRQNYIKPFQDLQDQGVGVMVMEFGCYNQTPHGVALQWMKDALSLFKEAGWGWALWEWEGTFGPVNSGRTDVVYEEVDGRKIDRKMMDLLKLY